MAASTVGHVCSGWTDNVVTPTDAAASSASRPVAPLAWTTALADPSAPARTSSRHTVAITVGCRDHDDLGSGRGVHRIGDRNARKEARGALGRSRSAGDRDDPMTGAPP